MGDMQGPDMADECRAACAEKREARCAIDGPQGADGIRAEKGRTTTRISGGARGYAAHATALNHFPALGLLTGVVRSGLMRQMVAQMHWRPLCCWCCLRCGRG